MEDKESEKLKNMNVEEQLEHFKDLYKNVDMKLYGEKMTSCFKKLTEAIAGNLEENSEEVQGLMKEYFEIIKMTHPMSKKKWLGMGVTIGENKEIYTMYAKMHPRLPEFLAKAIKIYGENLTE